MHGLAFDIAHLLAGALVLVSFMLLYQDRLYALLNVFALHALGAGAVGRLAGLCAGRAASLRHRGDRARLQGDRHPGGAAPDHRPARHPSRDRDRGRHRPDHAARHGAGGAVDGGDAAVTAEADPLAREDLAFALSVVLLGLLMMVTRRNAVSQVVGFMSLENGLVLAATGAKGMPLVVEISVAFSILIAFIVIGIFLFRIRERFDTVDVHALDRFRGERLMSFDAVTAVLAIPATAALLLALLPGYRLTARLNVAATLLTFLAALSLFFVGRPEPGPICWSTISTSSSSCSPPSSASPPASSARAISRMSSRPAGSRRAILRFYHAMYQVLMFAMNLALVANNIGLMWVAIELATLTTVLMVGIYRTHEALEAAWKYFILGSVGIALALFGTILVYMAARAGDRRGPRRHGVDRCSWRMRSAFDPALLNVAFVFLLLGYGTKVGLAPLHAWLPDAHAEGPTPISAVLSGLLLNVALYAVLRFKMLLAANPRRSRRAR